jgi:hypothetical protein
MTSQQHVSAEPPSTETRTSAIDLADLVSTLLALESPDRDIDIVVDAMLGQKEALLSIDHGRVRTKFWLRSQVPTYTAGGEALRELAHARGCRIRTCEIDGIWTATAHDAVRNSRTEASARFEGVAGIVAIAFMTAKEKVDG